MKISEKQHEFLGLLEDPSISELLIGGSAGGPLVFGSKVKTPFGEKNIEDIRIGDQVSSASGGVTRVIDIPYEGVDECYKITFVDGATVECSCNHIWKYKLAKQSRRKHLTEFTLGTTKQIIQKMQKYNVLVPLTEPVVFTIATNKKKIDPYLLGVILGDGSISCGMTLTSADEEIVEKCRKVISGQLVQGKNPIEYRFVGCRKEKEILDSFGLIGKRAWEKEIPHCYKFGSIEERKALLQGLMDTDGTVDSRGHLSFTSTSEQLAKDVQFIARSLGANATLSKYEKSGYKNDEGEFIQCRPAYSVYIQHEHKEWFVSLKRKLDRIKPYNNGSGVPNKCILSIEPIGKKKVRCISIAALDGLFLTNDFVVTHNSKTVCMCMGVALLGRKYPGARFYIARKTLKSLKQSTIATLLNKVHPLLGITINDYAMHFSDMTLDYKNGSKLIFGELETTPSDEDFARVGSLEIDMALIDEAGEITIKAKNAIKSRVGRGVMAEKYGIPGKLILSANPSQNFLRQEYYDPYIQLGGGGFQKWKIGDTKINGKKIDTYRAFLRMGAYDNPFLPPSYIDNLKTLPDRERKRLLDGDWNYADDESSLFRAGLLDKAITYELPTQDEEFDKWIGVDVAGQGGDRSVYTLFDNGVIIAQKISSIQNNWDKTDQRPLFRLMADELIEFAQRNGFTQATANHIAVEGNGIGQALITCLKERGWHLTEYTATHKSRSEGYYNLMLAMDSGDLKIINTLTGLDDLRRELSAHSYEFINQEPSVVKKEKIKQIIGRSPDLADSLMISYWCKDFMTNTANNPRLNRSRIYF